MNLSLNAFALNSHKCVSTIKCIFKKLFVNKDYFSFTCNSETIIICDKNNNLNPNIYIFTTLRFRLLCRVNSIHDIRVDIALKSICIFDEKVRSFARTNGHDKWSIRSWNTQHRGDRRAGWAKGERSWGDEPEVTGKTKGFKAEGFDKRARKNGESGRG